MRTRLFALALLLLPLATTAQEARPVPATATTAAAEAPTPELAPFVATYKVYRGGKHLGEATMQLVRQQPPRWRVDLVMRGTRGLIGLAGINAEQSTVFYEAGGAYRPLSQATVTKTVFTRDQTVGVYDWSSRQARWSGDAKEHRKGPIALQDGDMTGLLINLALIRDAEPGKTLEYRFVDDGRTRQHQYTIDPQTESISIAGIAYTAMKATRAKDDNEETVVWVARNVPSPIRILQRENGEDTYDLRLVDYKGVE